VRLFLIPALALLLGTTPAAAQTATADIVLVNGKIVTVDDRFTIAQALAIRDQRIVAVGTNAEIDKLKGPQTRTVELAGRTVIPGLIDNHSHWIRAAEHNELRFDGVTTRKRAIALLNDRVRAAKPGEWIAVLGGWSEQQFTDEERGFSRAELDAIAPDHPVVLQSVYNHRPALGVLTRRSGHRGAT
jgi:predicted amidohydrolase YtcJ